MVKKLNSITRQESTHRTCNQFYDSTRIVARINQVKKVLQIPKFNYLVEYKITSYQVFPEQNTIELQNSFKASVFDL